MTGQPDKFQLALIQMRVGPDKQDNLDRARALITEAAGKGARLAVLPEMFNCPYEVSRFAEFAEPLTDGPTGEMLAGQAAKHGIYLVGGSMPERDGRDVFNTATLWDPNGRLILSQRKVHLFDVDIPGGISIKESDRLSPGNRMKVVETELGVWGLAICYDIRFPEFFRRLALSGAELIIVPGAFNTTTGPFHWEVLIRARALENTLYVAACGAAPHPGVAYPAWGHSMVVDPFGWIIDSAERDQEIIYAEFDRARLQQVRKSLPVLAQRRPEVYYRHWEGVAENINQPSGD